MSDELRILNNCTQTGECDEQRGTRSLGKAATARAQDPHESCKAASQRAMPPVRPVRSGRQRDGPSRRQDDLRRHRAVISAGVFAEPAAGASSVSHA